MTHNIVFIATSLDGYIADPNGNIDWLHEIPNPEGIDMGFMAIQDRVDALLMGRTTFETVLSFGVDWPYQKPVFVLSSKLEAVPKELEDKVFLVSGAIETVLKQIHDRGYRQLYVDGGRVIRSLMELELIDELIVSSIPIVLGGGKPLYPELSQPQRFELVDSTVYLDAIVQSHYKKKG